MNWILQIMIAGKQEIKEIRKLLLEVMNRLEKVAPGLSSVKLKEDQFTETGKAIIESWIPRGQFMLNKLAKILVQLPVSPRRRFSKTSPNSYTLKGWTLLKGYHKQREEVNFDDFDIKDLSNWETWDNSPGDLLIESALSDKLEYPTVSILNPKPPRKKKTLNLTPNVIVEKEPLKRKRGRPKKNA
jgi:hypothetical protein